MPKVLLLTHTPTPEQVVAAAAKLCYSPVSVAELTERITEESAADFVEMLSEIGHASPIEHANFTFAIEGVSRSLLAQITRHRIASFSVQSQRYVREKKFEYITPPEISKIPEALSIYEEAMEKIHGDYITLANTLKEKHLEQFLSEGMEEKAAKRAAEKKGIEDARFVLPNACTTKMIVTMNARSLLNFFAHRCCNRAQWEILEVADLMLCEVMKVAPSLFKNAGPKCLSGKCPEGSMSCGEMQNVRAKYKELFLNLK